jgi:hypothetical protein
MREHEVQVVRASEVRRSLTVPGDIRGEIGFQNDINALLARFDEVRVPWRALSGPSPTFGPSVVADMTPMPSPAPASRRYQRVDATMPRLRVVDGGAPTLGLGLGPVTGTSAASPLPRPKTPVGPSPRIMITTTTAPVARPTNAPVRAAGARTPRRRG